VSRIAWPKGKGESVRAVATMAAYDWLDLVDLEEKSSAVLESGTGGVERNGDGQDMVRLEAEWTLVSFQRLRSKSVAPRAS